MKYVLGPGKHVRIVTTGEILFVTEHCSSFSLAPDKYPHRIWIRAKHDGVMRLFTSDADGRFPQLELA
jgi:hypothetical protein